MTNFYFFIRSDFWQVVFTEYGTMILGIQKFLVRQNNVEIDQSPCVYELYILLEFFLHNVLLYCPFLAASDLNECYSLSQNGCYKTVANGQPQWRSNYFIFGKYPVEPATAQMTQERMCCFSLLKKKEYIHIINADFVLFLFLSLFTISSS